MAAGSATGLSREGSLLSAPRGFHFTRIARASGSGGGARDGRHTSRFDSDGFPAYLRPTTFLQYMRCYGTAFFWGITVYMAFNIALLGRMPRHVDEELGNPLRRFDYSRYVEYYDGNESQKKDV